MGKSILKVSRWSIRSLVILYGKAATFFFAVICVLSGLTARSVSAATSAAAEKTYKGKVLFLSDSTFVKNVKLYLCRVAYPSYGMTGGPVYLQVDSTETDSFGNFMLSSSSDLTSFALTTADRIKHNSTIEYIFVTTEAEFTNNKDTSFTLYMSPYQSVSVNKKMKSTPDYSRSVLADGIVSIAIPEWHNSKLGVIVYNSLGEKVTSTESHEPGTIRWNTSNIAKGYYMLHISNGSRTIATSVIIK